MLITLKFIVVCRDTLDCFQFSVQCMHFISNRFIVPDKLNEPESLVSLEYEGGNNLDVMLRKTIRSNRSILLNRVNHYDVE